MGSAPCGLFEDMLSVYYLDDGGNEGLIGHESPSFFG